MDLNTSILKISKNPILPHSSSKVILETARVRLSQSGISFDNDSQENFETMSIYLYPTGSISKLINVTIFFNVLYYLDDNYASDSKNFVADLDINDIVNVLTSTDEIFPKISQGLYNAIKSLNKILGELPSAVKIKVTKLLVEHLSSALASREYLSLENYVNERVKISGMFLAINMAEYVYDLPEIDLEEVTVLRKLCAEIGALSNDIFSFPKEAESIENLINVLLYTKNANSIKEAILKAIEMVNIRTEEFNSRIINLKKNLNDYRDKKHVILNYLRALEDIISASYSWQLHSNRYHHPLHFFTDMR
jgi:hypothetical protein